MFRRNTKWAVLEKRVTPHMIRHTTATNLLRNGCPIGFIKEILGHENLETTCRYYLGILNKKDVKFAHETYTEFATGHDKFSLVRKIPNSLENPPQQTQTSA